MKSIFKHIVTRETFKNKVTAVILLTLGWIANLVIGDGTVFIIMCMLAIPLFLNKENVMEF